MTRELPELHTCSICHQQADDAALIIRDGAFQHAHDCDAVDAWLDSAEFIGRVLHQTQGPVAVEAFLRAVQR